MAPPNSLAVVNPNAQALAERGTAELVFTPEQEQMIRDSFANGASPNEFAMLMGIAKARRLNPLLRQIHFVKRWDSQKQREVWAVQVSIDGLRAIAERTGKYDGQDEPEFERDGKGLIAAKVRVYRKDWGRPAVGVALFDEYAQRKKDGSVTQMWREKPHIMLAKCAEALALRKAFPEDMGGLYVAEEFPEQERRQQISPHIGPEETGDEQPHDGSPFLDLEEELVKIESAVDAMLVPGARPAYDDVLRARAELGSVSKQSPLLKAIQEATEGRRLVPDERKILGKTWQRTSRKLAKLEATVKPPPAEDSFTDPPDEDDRNDLVAPYGREPGED